MFNIGVQCISRMADSRPLELIIVHPRPEGTFLKVFLDIDVLDHDVLDEPLLRGDHDAERAWTATLI